MSQTLGQPLIPRILLGLPRPGGMTPIGQRQLMVREKVGGLRIRVRVVGRMIGNSLPSNHLRFRPRYMKHPPRNAKRRNKL